AGGDTESVVDRGGVETRMPAAAHLTHPQRQVRSLRQVAYDLPVPGAIGVHVHLADGVACLLVVGAPVAGAAARVGLVYGGDVRVGGRGVLLQPVPEGSQHLLLPLGSDVHALLPATDG